MEVVHEKLMRFTAALIIPALISLVITPLVKRFAQKVGAIDMPNERKIHREPIPRLGGIAIATSFFIACFALYLIDQNSVNTSWILSHKGWLLFGSLLLMLGLGIWDDIQTLSPGHKFFVQLVAATVCFEAGFTISGITNPFSADTLDVGVLAYPLTILWIVGVTNACNLIDGLDGLAGGVGVIAALTIFSILVLNGDPTTALIMLAFAGSVIGFLRYNFHPATIFLGDSGSLFVGFFLAVLSIESSTKGSTAVAILIPILTLGLPIMDTLISMARRFLGSFLADSSHGLDHHGNGRNGKGKALARIAGMFLPDRKHIHHQLLSLGLSHRRSVVTLYVVSCSFGLIALALTASNRIDASLVVLAVAVATFAGVRHLRYREMAILQNGIFLPLYDWPVIHRSLFQGFIDLAFCVVAFTLSLSLTVPTLEMSGTFHRNALSQMPLVCGTQICALAAGGLYKATVRYFGVGDLLRIIRAVAIAVVCTAVIITLASPIPSRSLLLYVVDFYILLTLVAGSRISFRVLTYLFKKEAKNGKKIVIYGAGEKGILTLQQILNDDTLNLSPIGFLDDSPSLEGKKVNGYAVFGGHWKLPQIVRRYNIEEVLISSNDLLPEVLRRIKRIADLGGVSLKQSKVSLQEYFPAKRTETPRAALLQKNAARNHVAGILCAVGMISVLAFPSYGQESLLPPALATPPNGATDQPTAIEFRWHPSFTATHYELQVATTPNFTSMVYQETSIPDTLRLVSPLPHNTQLYWRVRAFTILLVSDWSEVWSFSTIPLPPSPPILLTPPDGSTNVSMNPTVTWDTASGATTYRIQVDTSTTFNAPVVDVNGIVSTSYVLSDLEPSTTYQWRARASNASGSSSWSDVWDFTTVPLPPIAPTLVAPNHGATDIPVDVTLNWNLSPGASTYRAQVALSANFTPPLVVDQGGITATSLTLSGLENNTRYYWRASASNAGGASVWSETWEFTTVPVPPATPILLSPPDGAVNQSTSLTLSWDTVAQANMYGLQVSTSPSFQSVVVEDSFLTTTSRLVQSLAENTTYYWRVRARNSSGQSNWSQPWRFTTTTSQVEAPILDSPPDGAVNQGIQPTLRWNATPNATSYQLQVAKNATFTPTVNDSSGITTTSVQIGPLDSGTTYYWRARAFLLAIPSEWSSVWRFTTVMPLPGSPLLLSPANGSTGQPTNILLQWSTSTGATHYRVQVSTSNSFTTTIVDDSTLTSTSRSLTSLSQNTTYYWRVRAKNSTGWGTYSPVWNFRTVSSAAPIVSTLAATNITSTSALLRATVNPNGSLTSVKFYFVTQVNNSDSVNGNPSTVSGTQTVNITATIQGLSPNTLYRYRVVAMNSAGTAYGNDQTFTTPLPPYPSTYNLSTTVVFPSYQNKTQYKSSDYRIIGLPGASNAPVATYLPGTPSVDWQMYWDNGAATNGIVTYSESADFRFTVGRAFWLIKKGAWTLSAQVPSASLNAAQEVEIPLHPGWNLITNPFDGPLRWSSIQRTDTITEPLYTFNGNFTMTDEFKPYTGYYFFNARNLPVLRIPYALVFENPDSTLPPPVTTWKIRIILACVESVDSLLWLGTAKDAAEAKDIFDVHKPVAIDAQTWTAFRRPSWNNDYPVYASDVRSELSRLATWSFEVYSKSRKSIHLTFEGVSSVPNGFDVYFLDRKRARVVHLNNTKHYTFMPIEDTSEFFVVVGERAAVQEVLKTVPSPKQFVLGTNYPNPFNASTVIPVEIPQHSRIVVSIFNTLGQKIATVYDEWIDAGKYWFYWDGRDHSLSSGVYLYRLWASSGFVQTKKMTYVK